MQEITVDELKARIDAGEKLNVIDVREPAEYQEYNLGGMLIPLGRVMGMQIDELDDMKDEEIIVHCKAGKRSMQACMFMEQMGFTNLKSLAGGADAWKEKYADTKVN